MPVRPTRMIWRCAAAATVAAVGLIACDDSTEPPRPTTGAQTAATANPDVVPAPLPNDTGPDQAKKTSKKPNKRTVATLAPSDPEPLEPQRRPNTAQGSTSAVHWALTASMSWPGQGSPLRLTDSSPKEIQEIQQRLSRELEIELQTDGYMSVEFTSSGFPLPSGSLLQARPDHYGHLLVWPKGGTYRVLPQGSLHSLFSEHRVDVSPLELAKTEGPTKLKERRLGFPMQRTTLEVSRGKLILDDALVPETGNAGVPLCRLLLELLLIAPSDNSCDDEHIPVRATYEFSDGASLLFVVDSLRQNTEVTQPVSVPPSGAQFSQTGLPATRPALLNRDELGRLRSADETAQLRVKNNDPTAVTIHLDSIPVARIDPHSTRIIEGIAAGEYELSIRDFFGRQLRHIPKFKIDPDAQDPSASELNTRPILDAGPPPGDVP